MRDPHDAWYRGKKFYDLPYHRGTEHLLALERALTQDMPATCVLSTQFAIELILETLDARTSMVPVVMSVLAPLPVMMGVLHGGGIPILLDVDESTLQMRPDHLQQSLQDLDMPAVVLLDRPAGKAIDYHLIALVEEHVSVEVSDFLPDNKVVSMHQETDFSVYSLNPLVGCGAVLYSQWEDLHKTLHSQTSTIYQKIALPNILASVAEYRYGFVREIKQTQRTCYLKYSDLLKEMKSDAILVESSEHPYAVLTMENATKIMKRPVNDVCLFARPLHLFPGIQERLPKDPEFPVAMKLHQTALKLPTSDFYALNLSQITKMMKKLVGGSNVS